MRHRRVATARDGRRLEGVETSDGVGSKSELIARLREREAEILSLGVKRLGLFGSFVRDEAGPESDVDLLVEFERGEKSFDRFMALSFLLEDALQRPVELVTTEALSPHLGPRILESTEYVAGVV